MLSTKGELRYMDYNGDCTLSWLEMGLYVQLITNGDCTLSWLQI